MRSAGGAAPASAAAGYRATIGGGCRGSAPAARRGRPPGSACAPRSACALRLGRRRERLVGGGARRGGLRSSATSRLQLLAAQRALARHRLRALGRRLRRAAAPAFWLLLLGRRIGGCLSRPPLPPFLAAARCRPPPDRPPSRRSFRARWCSAGAGSRRPGRSSPALAGSCDRPNSSTRRSSAASFGSPSTVCARRPRNARHRRDRRPEQHDPSETGHLPSPPIERPPRSQPMRRLADSASLGEQNRAVPPRHAPLRRTSACRPLRIAGKPELCSNGVLIVQLCPT